MINYWVAIAPSYYLERFDNLTRQWETIGAYFTFPEALYYRARYLQLAVDGFHIPRHFIKYRVIDASIWAVIYNDFD